MKEDAMVKALLMISAFTLIFMASASAQNGIGKRRNFTTNGQQQGRYWYEQQRRSERDGPSGQFGTPPTALVADSELV
jgi:hypothetical protein